MPVVEREAMSEGQEMRGSEKMWLKIDNSNVWLTGAQLWPEPPALALTFPEPGLSPW